jgi:hypothetical protein
VFRRRLAAFACAALVCAELLLGRPARADEGMWPFNHLPRAALQERYGFVASDAWLAHVRRSSLRIGGGSGSFVSSHGLLLTNHHCVEDCISRLSSSSRDYQKLGFYAKTADQELACPGYSVQQLGEVTDVTARIAAVTQGLAGAAFQRALLAEKARLEQDCRTDPESSCELVSLYRGGLYELYQYRRYADVRLVFAPERDAALFGGDPDNFTFPRYDLDLAVLRAYVAGKPAVTPDHLAWSSSGLSANELVFVSGNPGTTERLRTVAELEFLRDHALVTELLQLAQYRGFLNEYAERGAEARRVASLEIQRVENTYKELEGARLALASRAFFARLVERENELRARVAARLSWQASYGAAWDAIAEAHVRGASMANDWLWIEGPPGFRPPWAKTTLFGFARTLVRAAAERSKDNPERLPEFTDARLPMQEQHLLAAQPLNESFEIAKLRFGLSALREALGVDHPFVRKVLGRASPEELARSLVQGSHLNQVEQRRRLWFGGQAAVLASRDPMIVLARRIDDDGRALRARFENEIQSVLTRSSELLARARFLVYGMSSYPDATGSPRLSFGTVRGWREPGRVVPAFTTLGGAFERHTGRWPFALPPSWLAHQSELALDTPFNFVTDADIVGGNSGSPVLNRQGELVGLVFDGNLPSLGGSYGYDMATNRSVAIDVRAIAHTLEHIYAAHRLTEELFGAAASGRGISR